MNLEAKNTLQTAISDVGYWRWWNQIEDNCQIEFGGVLLLDDTKEGKEARTSVVALIHYGNAFVIFLDNEEPEGWFEALHRDEQEPYTLDPESLVFDDVEYAIRIFNSFSNRKSSTEQVDEEMIRNAKCVVAATSENVGFIAGGDELRLSETEDCIRKRTFYCFLRSGGNIGKIIGKNVKPMMHTRRIMHVK